MVQLINRYRLHLLWAILSQITTHIAVISAEDLSKQAKLPPCRACKTYISSFEKGIKLTAKGNFEGGDAAWEEEKLGTYATSEVRLTEIQENVCKDVTDGQSQCYVMNEQYDTIIEDWWFNHQKEHPDLFVYFCIDKIKQCCPENHFGANCTPCVGFPDNVCSNNGRCKGAGTRKGNGQCACENGYTGQQCESCNAGFYEAYKDDKKLLCAQCHASCSSEGCTKPGPSGCISCAVGWIADENKSCLDINECAGVKSPCSPLQFCVNSEGSYQCLDCDRSCAGCTGDGPDMCTRCASGYVLKDNTCVDSDQEGRHRYVLFTRYATYIGLCIATSVIFQRSVMLAAVIGVIVAVYIATSEYILNSPPTPTTTGLADQIMRATNQLH